MLAYHFYRASTRGPIQTIQVHQCWIKRNSKALTNCFSALKGGGGAKLIVILKDTEGKHILKNNWSKKNYPASPKGPLEAIRVFSTSELN